ncbi:tetratricopeptide repeat protein [Pedobacter sp. NJ-S-72]
MSYNYMGRMQADVGDYYGGQESLMLSLTFLNDKEEKNFGCLSSDYNELGLNLLHFKDYDLAITYYDKAAKYSNNKAFNLISLSNIALAYEKAKKYPQAIKIYNEVISNKDLSQKEYANSIYLT